jgi:heptosyltransferase-2
MTSRERPGRVLIRIPNWLGDALMARPFLHAVRHAFPGARVVATGPAGLLALLAPERLWDDAVAWPPTAAARATLRASRPDLAFVLPPSFSSAWWALRTGARRRSGFTGDTRGWLLTDPVRRPARGEMHLGDEYLALGAPWGIGAPGPLPSLAPTPDAEREAAELRARAGAGDRAYAVVAPGAAYGPAKRWSFDRFAGVAQHLARRGWHVLLCGARADREACETVAARGTGTVLAGESSLGVMAALTARAQVVVSNDSGLAHLGAATGAPTVVVFGSTSSAWTAPIGPRVSVVQDAPPCAPCFQRTCRIGYQCLEAVQVAQVVAACDRWVA